MDPCYESLKCELQTFTWPEIPILPDAAEEDCVTSQDDSVTSLEDVSPREDVLPNADEPSEEEVADSKLSASASAPEEEKKGLISIRPGGMIPISFHKQARFGLVGFL